MGHGGFLARFSTVTVWSMFSPLHSNPPKHLWEAWCEKEFLTFFLCHDPAFLEMPVS